MTEEPSQTTSFRGIYRGGLIRLLDAPPWADGCQVEVQLADAGSTAAPPEVGLVLVAGYGLAGRWVSGILERHGIDYVVIEQNPVTVKRQKQLGHKIVLGDVSEEATLYAAGIERAGILALTIPDERAVLRATETARRLRPDIYIVARTTYTSAGMEAAKLGADAVVKAEQAVANRFYELLLHKLRAVPKGG